VTLARMANDSEAREISDADLDQWYRVHNGKDLDGGPAGIGIQARSADPEADRRGARLRTRQGSNSR